MTKKDINTTLEPAIESKDKKESISVTMKNNVLECDTNGEDGAQLFGSMIGVKDKHAFDLLLKQAVSSSSALENDYRYNSVMPLLLDIAPQDALEGMLAVQMVAVHNLAMEMTKRALIDGQTVDGVNNNVNRITKLMNTYKSQVETLQKYRNKGQQTIQVQHVTVNDGGQAVVGNVAGGEG